MSRHKSLIGASLAVLLLAACSSGGLGDILGGGSSPNNYEIRGTVDSVDTNSRSIFLRDVSGYNSSMLSSGGSGNTVRLYYDDRTTVHYNGQAFRPQDLERGDQVSATVDEDGNSLVAQAVTVTYNVSAGSSSYPSTNPSGSILRGTVRYVDTSRQEIEVESTSWISGFNSGTSSATRRIIRYDSSTRVDVSGQLHPVSGLEAGDVIEVQVDNPNTSTLFANRIFLVRDVRR